VPPVLCLLCVATAFVYSDFGVCSIDTREGVFLLTLRFRNKFASTDSVLGHVFCELIGCLRKSRIAAFVEELCAPASPSFVWHLVSGVSIDVSFFGALLFNFDAEKQGCLILDGRLLEEANSVSLIKLMC